MSKQYELRDKFEENIFGKYSTIDAVNIISEKRKMEMWGAITDILIGKKKIRFIDWNIKVMDRGERY